MPFRTYNAWLFDGSKKSNFPQAKYSSDGKELIPDILNYKSPITHTYAISMFLKHGPLNYYLNKYFNNINLRYLDKKELFIFLKKCVLDFRVKKFDITYFKRDYKTRLYGILRNKFPELKNCDISLLCEIIDDSNEKDNIYQTLGLEKVKRKKTKKEKPKVVNYEEFIARHFSIMKY